jgi:hypothetical protein
VGIGFGGPVDDATHTVIKSHQIEGWDNFPLGDWLADVVGLPETAHPFLLIGDVRILIRLERRPFPWSLKHRDAPGPQDTMEFRHRRMIIWDVFQYVAAEDDVERGVFAEEPGSFASARDHDRVVLGRRMHNAAFRKGEPRPPASPSPVTRPALRPIPFAGCGAWARTRLV